MGYRLTDRSIGMPKLCVIVRPFVRFVRAVVRHVFARVLQQRISNPVAIVDERRKALEVLLVRPLLCRPSPASR